MFLHIDLEFKAPVIDTLIGAPCDCSTNASSDDAKPIADKAARLCLGI